MPAPRKPAFNAKPKAPIDKSISNTSTVNGWHLFAHASFLNQYESLIVEVEKLREKYPNSYKDKLQTKRLAAITQLIFAKIPKDPTLPEYRQGNTLGHDYKHWFRAKFFQQYRLFFRYHFESKMIVYSWVNDENTKRAYHSKTDAYLVFRKMLQSGQPPNDWKQLLEEAKNENGRFSKMNKD